MPESSSIPLTCIFLYDPFHYLLPACSPGSSLSGWAVAVFSPFSCSVSIYVIVSSLSPSVSPDPTPPVVQPVQTTRTLSFCRQTDTGQNRLTCLRWESEKEVVRQEGSLQERRHRLSGHQVVITGHKQIAENFSSRPRKGNHCSPRWTRIMTVLLNIASI